MKTVKKRIFAGILLVAISLGGLYMFEKTLGTTVYAQDMVEVANKEELENIYVYDKSGHWDSFWLTGIYGNNTKYSMATTNTTKLAIFTTYNGSFIAHLHTPDGQYLEFTQESDNLYTIELDSSFLKANHTYSILINRIGICSFDVVEAPIQQEITITAADRTVSLNSTFDYLAGVSAFDWTGKDISDYITYRGAVDTSIPGDYPVTYAVIYEGISASKTVIVTVEEASTAVTPPALEIIDDQTTIVRGTGPMNSTIRLQIGTEIYETQVATDGSFEIRLEKPFAAGTGIVAYAINNEGLESERVYAIVEESTEFLLGVNKILTTDTMITGITIPNSSVKVSIDNNRAHIFEGTSDANGAFSINLKGYRYPAGTDVTITVTNKNGVSKSETVIIYPAAPLVNVITATDAYVTGTGEPNAIVYITINGTLFQGQVDEAGNFLIPVSGLSVGANVGVYQISNGIKSDTINLTVN